MAQLQMAASKFDAVNSMNEIKRICTCINLFACSKKQKLLSKH